jgi:energy-converting hydrogenase Eha subunit G
LDGDDERVPDVVGLVVRDDDVDLDEVAVTDAVDVADTVLDGVGDDVEDLVTLDDLVEVPEAEFEGVADFVARLE